MDLKALFAAVDKKPFQPFKIELISGRVLDVDHHENVFIMPSRAKVSDIIVYLPETETERFALFGPAGLVAVLERKNEASAG